MSFEPALTTATTTVQATMAARTLSCEEARPCYFRHEVLPRRKIIVTGISQASRFPLCPCQLELYQLGAFRIKASAITARLQRAR